ncbi:hypothetical protein RJ639_039763 [Escallonia herrerae]|uniref:Ninja-family protein n=1 Tax=Escallonia herrerae TaxID=1293975 RepID=A0AA88WN30_9ASTE|nr:hypothetical protein RJ639_039763 [Escallonia herrerae]
MDDPRESKRQKTLGRPTRVGLPSFHLIAQCPPLVGPAPDAARICTYKFGIEKIAFLRELAMDCGMVEVANVGMEGEGEEDEIELSLGLSIGGSFRKSKPKWTDSSERSVADLKEERDSLSKDVLFDADTHADAGGAMKRGVQATRRQKARVEREEKVKKGNRGVSVAKLCEGDGVELETASKKVKTEISGRNCVAKEEIKGLNLTLSYNGLLGHEYGSNPAAAGALSSCIQVVPVPVQYPYSSPPLNCAPCTNGYVYPFVMPVLAADNAGNDVGRSEKCGPGPAAYRSFRPYQRNVGDLRQNAAWNGSPEPSGSSSNVESKSNHSQSERQQLQMLNASAESELRGSANSVELNELVHKAASPTKPSQEAELDAPVNNPLSTTGNHTNSTPPKEAIGIADNLSKSRAGKHDALPLPQMPCVSTTGNGPNGKTINGFLHRYTEGEITLTAPLELGLKSYALIMVTTIMYLVYMSSALLRNEALVSKGSIENVNIRISRANM